MFLWFGNTSIFWSIIRSHAFLLTLVQIASTIFSSTTAGVFPLLPMPELFSITFFQKICENNAAYNQIVYFLYT